MKRPNKIINYCLNHKSFYLASTSKPNPFQIAEDAQRLPLYNYTDEGDLVCNIADADWELERVNAHYRQHWGKSFEQAVSAPTITAADMLPYAYAVLHDPVYHYDLKDDPTRELPHLPLYRHFGHWAKLGRKLLELHTNFMTANPYLLKRVDAPNPLHEVILQANAQDKERGIIRIDDQTTLSGVPPEAWRHQLGEQTALEWVLNRYKARKPIDPTGAYRFVDHKKRLIDLLMRICAVSVETMYIVDSMAYWQDGNLIVFDDREQDDLMLLSLANWAREEEESAQ